MATVCVKGLKLSARESTEEFAQLRAKLFTCDQVQVEVIRENKQRQNKSDLATVEQRSGPDPSVNDFTEDEGDASEQDVDE